LKVQEENAHLRSRLAKLDAHSTSTIQVDQESSSAGISTIAIAGAAGVAVGATALMAFQKRFSQTNEDDFSQC
jgi:hypothetical protein|tara:strand:- start:139 stop:357 length:219 start_codon:yes stop_codon:yes gene_type:complete